MARAQVILSHGQISHHREHFKMSSMHVELFKTFLKRPSIFFCKFNGFFEIDPTACFPISNQKNQEARDEPDQNEVTEGKGYLMKVRVKVDGEPGEQVNNAEH